MQKIFAFIDIALGTALWFVVAYMAKKKIDPFYQLLAWVIIVASVLVGVLVLVISLFP